MQNRDDRIVIIWLPETAQNERKPCSIWWNDACSLSAKGKERSETQGWVVLNLVNCKDNQHI